MPPSKVEVPKEFTDRLETHAHVQAALRLLPRPPNGYPEARRNLRAAEWAWKSATSRDLAATANLYASQLREYERLELNVGSLPKLLEAARALVEACPGEAQRLRNDDARRRRRLALEVVQGVATRKKLEGLHQITEQEAQQLLDLSEQVAADEAEVAAEGEANAKLSEAVDAAMTAAIATVTDAMRAQVQARAREYSEVIKPKAALWRAFPIQAPGAPLISSAVEAAKVAARLGFEVDVDEEFLTRLDPIGCDVYCLVTRRELAPVGKA